MPFQDPCRPRRPVPALPASAAFLVVCALALGGCSWRLPEPATAQGVVAFLAPYRPDIVQGNVVTSEQLARIKPGMTRLQVREQLGTPLIADPFHAQRWDYVFSLVRQGFPTVERQFAVTFDGDAVQKIDAPELPTEEAFVAQISRRPLPDSVPKLELTDAERSALPPPRAPAPSDAASAASLGPTRTYPPLEAP